MDGTVIVVGAAGGLGSAAARALSAQGYRVALADRDFPAVSSLAESLPHAIPIDLDVTNEDSVAKAFTKAEEQLGPVRALVSCVGGTVSTQDRQPRFIDSALDDWIRTEAVNARGTFLCVREMLRLRVAVTLPDARIVLVASTAAQRPAPAMGVAYCASKAAVIAIARSATAEAADLGMTVNVVAPGGFNTAAYHVATRPEQMQRQIEGIPLRRLGAPEEFGALVHFLLTKEAGYITGATIDLNGGARMA